MLKPRSRESYLWSEVRPRRHGCRSSVPEAEEVEVFTAFCPPVPLWTPFSSMGIGTSCKKTGVQLHTILPVAQCASRRKDRLPWSCVCQEALWVVRGRREVDEAPGCLSQQGHGAHWVCTAPVSQGTWGSPPGGICVINLLWAVGEDFLGSSSTEEIESSC